MSDPVETVVRVYNKFVVDMLLSLKAGNAELRRALRTSHKAIDPASAAYIASAKRTLPTSALTREDLVLDAVLDDAAVRAFEPLEGVSVATLAATEDAQLRAGLRAYVYLLAALAATHAECTDESAALEGRRALATNALRVLSSAQKGGALPTQALHSILDDDIVRLLERLAKVSASLPASATSDDSEGSDEGGEGGAGGMGGMGADMADVMRALENSKIAELAQEISKEIDLSSLPMDDPSKLFNFADLGDKNSVLGSIVGKVGSKIQSKLASGELKHDELLGDAMSMLKMFGGNSSLAGLTNNPIVGEVLKAAQKGKLNMGGLAGAQRSSSARDRLRTKMAKRAADAAGDPKE